VGEVRVADVACVDDLSVGARRYERASLMVTSNKPFSGWGEIVGDEVTAMID
jgi:DNA replication protein DnaC